MRFYVTKRGGPSKVAEVMVNGSTIVVATLEDCVGDRTIVTNGVTIISSVFEDRAKRYESVKVTGGVGCIGTRVVRAANNTTTTCSTAYAKEQRRQQRRKKVTVLSTVHRGYQPRRDPAPGRIQGPRCRDTRPSTTRRITREA